MARARRSEPGGSWLGGAQLWLVARPPLKKRLTRVLERCKPGGAPRAPWPSGFSFFRFSSAGREGRIEGIGGGHRVEESPVGGGAAPQCLPATVRSLWERVMGCRGRLRASSSAVLGEWLKVRRGWVPGGSRAPWPRMAVSRSSSGGRMVRRVSASPSVAGSVCMALSARSRAQPLRGPSSVEMATSTVRAGGPGVAVPSPFTAGGGGPEE